MELTDKEKKLLQQSIDHWQEDIINQFVGGNKPDKVGKYWTKSKKIVRDRGVDCPLCQEANEECVDCVYYCFYGVQCDSEDGDWYKWNSCRSKVNAIAMRDALQNILDS